MEEILGKAFEYFINNNISLRQLSQESEQLIGQHLSYDVLKKISAEEGWLEERHRIVLSKLGSREDQINAILDQAAAMLQSPEVITSPSAWSSIANTFFSGLNKMGVKTENQTSGKTDLQSALEEYAKSKSAT